MEVSIVIPNYNGEELLKKNLPKVLAAVGAAEVIVVDDCSTDASASAISNFKFQIVRKCEFCKQKPNFKFLQNEKNLGFSSTVNRGVREANSGIIVLLNTDVLPEKDFLEPLLKHFDDPKVFAVGCMDKSIEDGKTVLRGRGIGRWQRGFLVHARGEVDKTDTLWVAGGSGAFRKSIWEKLGGFDELYNPFYYEDIDLSYRAVKSGFKVLFEPKSVVIHEHEKGAIKKKYSPFKIKAIAYRNQFIFAWKNATDFSLWVSHILWFPYHFVKALLRADLPFFLGFLAAFIRLPNVIQSRLKASRLFVKHDYEVIRHYSRF